jgi:hypothetical protein
LSEQVFAFQDRGVREPGREKLGGLRPGCKSNGVAVSQKLIDDLRADKTARAGYKHNTQGKARKSFVMLSAATRLVLSGESDSLVQCRTREAVQTR